jgi:DNA-binding NtrC family response regulator
MSQTSQILPREFAARAIARVLIIDDEPHVLAVGKAVLEAHGFEAVVSRSGEDALELVRVGVEGGQHFTAAIPMPPEVRAAQLPPSSSPVTVGAGVQQQSWQQLLALEATERLSRSDPEVWSVLTQQFERTILQSSLEVCRGRRVEAATRLGMGRNTITRKLRELGMDAGAADVIA